MLDAFDLTDALLAITSERDASEDPAADSLGALERVRHACRGAIAVLWLVSGGYARRLLHVGAPDNLPTIVELGIDSIASERLRHNGVVRCHAGEVTGVEPLVPAAASSYIAAATTMKGTVTGVLVIGWQLAAVPCDDRRLDAVRLAATLLVRPFLSAPDQVRQTTLQTAIIDSFIDRIATLDRQGTIISVNTAWHDPLARESLVLPSAVGIGANYFDVCRRAMARGCHDAERALAGLLDIANGSAQSFELAYQGSSPGPTGWWLLKAVPLRHPYGGVVLRHIEVTGATTNELANVVGEERFRALTDVVPVPVFMIDPDGLVEFGNGPWHEATSGQIPLGSPWTAACHIDECQAATTALAIATRNRCGFEVEVRLRQGDGTYRWWAATARPFWTAGGDLRGYVVTCRDVGTARHAQQALHDAGARLIASQEAVRSQIARELHDDLGQQVVMLATRVEAVTQQRRVLAKDLRDVLRQTQAGLQELARAVHNLSHELHPAKLRLLGLQRTIASLTRDLGGDSGIHVSFDVSGTIGALSDDRALCIFRIAQEALQNAVKHSGARTVDVALVGSPGHIGLRVTDDGVGFDSLALSTGLGLLTMRERIELIGGTLRIHTAPAAGTTVEATVPTAAA